MHPMVPKFRELFNSNSWLWLLWLVVVGANRVTNSKNAAIRKLEYTCHEKLQPTAQSLDQLVRANNKWR